MWSLLGYASTCDLKLNLDSEGKLGASERTNLEVELGDLKQSLAARAEAGVLGRDAVVLERFSHDLLQHLGHTNTTNAQTGRGVGVTRAGVLTQEL